MSVLTPASGLSYVFTFCLGTPSNCLFICNLRCSGICIHAKFPLHSVNQNFKLKLSHTGYNSLASFGIRFYSEGWIFVGKFPECYSHLFLVTFCCRFYC